MRKSVAFFNLHSNTLVKYEEAFQGKHFEAYSQSGNEGMIVKAQNYTCTETESYHCILELNGGSQRGKTNETVTDGVISKACIRQNFDATLSTTTAVTVGVSLLVLFLAVLGVLGVVFRCRNRRIDVIDDIEIAGPNISERSTPSDFSPRLSTFHKPEFGEGRLYYVLKNKWREDLKRVERKQKVRGELEEVAEKLHIWCSTMDILVVVLTGLRGDGVRDGTITVEWNMKHGETQGY